MIKKNLVTVFFLICCAALSADAGLYVSPGISWGYDFTSKIPYWSFKISVGKSQLFFSENGSERYTNLTLTFLMHRSKRVMTGDISSFVSLEMQFGNRPSSSRTMLDFGAGLAFAYTKGAGGFTLGPTASFSLGNFLFLENHLFWMKHRPYLCSGLQLVFPLPFDDGFDAFL